jgi:hypothetical protein
MLNLIDRIERRLEDVGYLPKLPLKNLIDRIERIVNRQRGKSNPAQEGI